MLKKRDWHHVYHMGQRLILISVCSRSVSKLTKTSNRSFKKNQTYTVFEELICSANICRLFLYQAASYFGGSGRTPVGSVRHEECMREYGTYQEPIH